MLTGFPLRRNPIATGMEAALPPPDALGARRPALSVIFCAIIFTIFVFAACQDFVSPADFPKTVVEQYKEEYEQRGKIGTGRKVLHAADRRRQ
jgi:hypothetical protein